MERLLEALAGAFALGPRRRLARRRQLFDTYDRRLLAEGRLLFREAGAGKGSLELTHEEGRSEVRLAEAAEPGLIAEMPPGRLREALATTVADRRLLPLVAIEERGFALALLDERGKTVARLAVVGRRAEAGEGKPARLARRAVLEPLRGYEGESEAAASALGAILATPAEGFRAEIDEALVATGQPLVPPSPKVEVPLDPAEPVVAAAGRMVGELTRVLVALEPGTRKALDPEFLHDFRVALRRLRSLVREVERVAPGHGVKRLRSELGAIAGRTGPCRDFDVLAADLAGHAAEMPAWAAEGLAILDHHVALRRAEAQREVAAALASGRWRRLLAALDHFARRAAATAAPEAAPIGEVARRRLAKAQRRFAREAEALGTHPAPEALHALRITGKRYRYLLELFAPLFPRPSLAPLVDELKQVQDLLGRANDFAVQGEKLRQLAAEAAHSAPRALAAGMAVGYLLARLESARGDLTRPLARALERLAKPAQRRRAERLFGGSE
ncbi:MAG TPA: CHAD domain-containing protein [Thermoanaerobaculia bacterium]|nr:CHAD domain-containing protein [Thermoanaerobaculia bacterium]